MAKPPPESLERALRDAAEGDADAWRELVGHYAPRVFGLLRAQCGDDDLAEEIAQSTFCTLAAKIEQYVEAGRFESWLFRIAMNRLRDELRRRKRHALPTESEVLVGLAGGVADEPDRADARQTAASDLADAMAKLPEADRRVVHLRHFGGLSFKQISELLEEPVGTLLARHHRALRKLRDLLPPE